MSGAKPTPERLSDRRGRMRLELEQEGVPILGGDAYPGPLAAAASVVDDLLLDELVYARHAPVHEGLRPQYGSLIVADVHALLDHVALAGPGEGIASTEPEPLRPMVDGVRTVLIRDLNGNVAVGHVDMTDELEVVNVLASTGGLTVQRLEDGRLRVGTRSGIALNDGGDWSMRSSVGSVIRNLTMDLALPEADRVGRMTQIRTLLDFSFHSLSPHGIGATIVVALDGTVHDLLQGTSDGGVEPALPLNFFDRRDQTLLRNVLAAVDGACLVDSSGSLHRYTVKLKASERSIQLVEEHGGTRHTSSKRFSFDHPGALVIVVSADGPVTLFCAGSALVKLRDTNKPADASWVRSTPSEVRLRTTQTRIDLTCERCGTPHVVAIATDDGVVVDAERTVMRGDPRAEPAPDTGVEHEVSCEACGDVLRTIANVVGLDSRIRRPWEPQSEDG